MSFFPIIYYYYLNNKVVLFSPSAQFLLIAIYFYRKMPGTSHSFNFFFTEKDTYLYQLSHRTHFYTASCINCLIAVLRRSSKSVIAMTQILNLAVPSRQSILQVYIYQSIRLVRLRVDPPALSWVRPPFFGNTF